MLISGILTRLVLSSNLIGTSGILLPDVSNNGFMNLPG